MRKKKKKIKIEYAQSNDVIRALAIAFLTCCIWLRGLFFRFLGSGKKAIITCSSLVVLTLLILYPVFTRADADGPVPLLSIRQSDTDASLIYGYKEESPKLEDSDEIGYIDYIITNDGDMDLSDIKFKFDDNYIKEFQLPTNMDQDSVNLVKGTSITLRAFFVKGIPVGEYNMEVSYSAMADEEEVSLSSHVNFNVDKRNLTITVPDSEIKAGEEVPVISVEQLIVDNLAEDDDITQCISGIRDVTYVVDDNNVTGEYVSEDLNSELNSSAYNIEFIPGKLIIKAADIDDSDSDEKVPDDTQKDTDSKSDDTQKDTDSKSDDTQPDVDSGQKNDTDDDSPHPEDKDTEPPTVTVSSPDMNMIGDTFVCRNTGTLIFELTDNVGVSGVQCVYGDHSEFYNAVDNKVEMKLPDDFEGEVFYQAWDLSGNWSDRGVVNIRIVEPVDKTAPTVSITSDDMKVMGDSFIAQDEAGTIIFHAVDVDPGNGDIVSGISKVICSVDGEDNELSVADGTASYELPKSFQGNIFYQAIDNAGNKSEVQTAKVVIEHTDSSDSNSDDSVIKVKVPTTLSLFIDPYRQKRNICSSEYTIINESGFDIECTIRNINQSINRDNIKDVDIDKTTNLELSLANGEETDTIKLPEGDSGQIYSGRILNGSDGTNSLTFWFAGTINSESAQYWENGDLRMVITYDLRKCE